jgi:hypothetical protein
MGKAAAIGKGSGKSRKHSFAWEDEREM